MTAFVAMGRPAHLPLPQDTPRADGGLDAGRMADCITASPSIIERERAIGRLADEAGAPRLSRTARDPRDGRGDGGGGDPSDGDPAVAPATVPAGARTPPTGSHGVAAFCSASSSARRACSYAWVKVPPAWLAASPAGALSDPARSPRERRRRWCDLAAMAGAHGHVAGEGVAVLPMRKRSRPPGRSPWGCWDAS